MRRRSYSQQTSDLPRRCTGTAVLLASGLVACFALLSGCRHCESADSLSGEVLVVERDPVGRLIRYVRTVDGVRDGLYVWDEGLGRTEGVYSNGYAAGIWRVWHANGMLKSRVVYTPEGVLEAEYYRPAGGLVSTVHGGFGFTAGFYSDGVVMVLGEMRGGEPAGVTAIWGKPVSESRNASTPYFRTERRQRLTAYERDLDNGSTREEISWHPLTGRVISVSAHAGTSKRIYDAKGRLLVETGPLPPFLAGDALLLPLSEDGRVLFTTSLSWSNGVCVEKRLPKKYRSGESLQ
ncbi:MAG: hypothetical protein HQ559_02420 [Lentisphaerae bacterium]|nr:hypothetical protein [Lentisphaerota bacterium]